MFFLFINDIVEIPKWAIEPSIKMLNFVIVVRTFFPQFLISKVTLFIVIYASYLASVSMCIHDMSLCVWINFTSKIIN